MSRGWTGRILAGVCAVALIALSCSKSGETPPTETGQGSGQETPLTGTLTIFAYEDGLVPEVLDPFKAANPGLNVKTGAFGSNDEAVTKLRGGFQADVINVCTEETPRMVDLGLLQPIDTSRVPQWNNLFPQLTGLNGVTLDGKIYMVPNTGGTSGIIYNPDEVSSPLTSYRQLFEDPELAGKVTFEDSAATFIPVTAMALGYEDPWNLDDAALQEIRDYAIAHKSNIRTFFKGDADFLNLYRSGEIIAGWGWHDYRVTMQNEGFPVELNYAEGALAWVCGMGISSNAQNLDAAYAALDYYASPDPQKFYAESYNYVISNQQTLDMLDPKVVADLNLDHPEQLQQAVPLQIPANYDQWLEIWREIKAA